MAVSISKEGKDALKLNSEEKYLEQVPHLTSQVESIASQVESIASQVKSIASQVNGIYHLLSSQTVPPIPLSTIVSIDVADPGQPVDYFVDLGNSLSFK